MNIAGEMQKCMVVFDIERTRQLWPIAFPHLPPITSDGEARAMLHLARTSSEALNTRLRFYSHQWLLERNLPSALPDHLRPSAERMYPRVAKAVGISVNANSELMRPIVPFVREAMSHAVLETFADGHKDDSDVVKRRMMEAKRTTVRKLLGVK
jgi:hypothetical protein